MSQSKQHPVHTQTLEEASSWFVDFSEGDVDASGREAFNRWLRTSPEHVRAYLQVTALWEDAALLNGSRADAIDVAALIEAARGETNVVRLPAASREASLQDQNLSAAPAAPHRDRMRRFAVAAGVLVVVAASLGWWQMQRGTTYSTQIGEQRSLTLPDGSLVELNSRSRLHVHFSKQQRDVELLEGQVLFHVAKDAARPFMVRSDATKVRAVGTQFDVYRKQTGTVVTVLEGRVAVSNSLQTTGLGGPASDRTRNTVSNQRESSGSVFLGAGEQVTVTARAVAPTPHANIAMATAWTQKKLMFESTPLSEVVNEFNRYNARQLVIDDAQLNEFHISGEFPSTSSDRLVEFLRQRFGVVLTTDSDEIRISRGTSSTP